MFQGLRPEDPEKSPKSLGGSLGSLLRVSRIETFLLVQLGLSERFENRAKSCARTFSEAPPHCSARIMKSHPTQISHNLSIFLDVPAHLSHKFSGTCRECPAHKFAQFSRAHGLFTKEGPGDPCKGWAGSQSSGAHDACHQTLSTHTTLQEREGTCYVLTPRSKGCTPLEDRGAHKKIGQTKEGGENRRVPPCAVKTCCASRFRTDGGGAAGSRSKQCPRARKAKCKPRGTI